MGKYVVTWRGQPGERRSFSLGIGKVLTLISGEPHETELTVEQAEALGRKCEVAPPGDERPARAAKKAKEA
jgi:hypothetical protein